MNKTALGITICGKSASDLEQQLHKRLNQRVLSGDLPQILIDSIEQTSFRVVPAGAEIDGESVERLRRLCQLWEVKLAPQSISSHRAFVGPLIVAAKKILFRMMQFLLKDSLHQQRSFNAEVIRALAEMAVKPNGDKMGLKETRK